MTVAAVLTGLLLSVMGAPLPAGALPGAPGASAAAVRGELAEVTAALADLADHKVAKELGKALDRISKALDKSDVPAACRATDELSEEIAAASGRGAVGAGDAAALATAAGEIHAGLGCASASDARDGVSALAAEIAALDLPAKIAERLDKELDGIDHELERYETGKACEKTDGFLEDLVDRTDRGELGAGQAAALAGAATDVREIIGCTVADDGREALAGLVTALGDLGIDEKTAKKLTKELEHADKDLEKYHVAKACERIDKFLARVDAAVGDGELTDGQRDDLSSATTTVQAILGCIEVAPPPPPPPPPAGEGPSGSVGSTSPFRSGQFLYTGDSPRQVVDDPEVFDPTRAGIASGRVLDRDGAPLPGVRVAVLGHAELGHTTSRADGTWDLAVNAGGALTFDFTAPGLLPVQRTVDTQWQDWVVVDDVVMTPLDPAVTPIDLGALGGGETAAHTGTTITDGDGTRTPYLLFSGGTTAGLRHPDGTTEPAPSPLNVRVTEYTVGDHGPTAMPAELPPASAYTYAAEFSVDGVPDGTSVVFEGPPVTVYLQDVDESEGTSFLGFPAGLAVPLGTYDRAAAAWDAEPNGIVIEIMGESGGLAEVDTTGDGAADNGTADTTGGPLLDAEREALATLFDPGDRIWRATISHFTPVDLNHPIVPPDDSVPPEGFDPFDGEERPVRDPSVDTGYGTLEYEQQVLREDVALPGVGQSLHYRSDRVPGRTRSLDLRLSGAAVPDSLVRIEASATIAGRRYTTTVPAGANRRWTFTWDGLDRFGRPVQGAQSVLVRIDYVYEGVYAVPARSATAFGLPTVDGYVTGRDGFVAARIETRRTSSYRTRLGGFDARSVGLAGWTLTGHHVYDAAAGVVHLGNGGQQGIGVIGSAVETVAGTGDPCGGRGHECLQDGLPADQTTLEPLQLVVADDGTTYFTNTWNAVFAVDPGGAVSHLAGANYSDPGVCRFYPSGVDPSPSPSHKPQCDTSGFVDARLVYFGDLSDIQMLPGGDVLIADQGNQRIYRVDPVSRALTVFAGTGEDCTDACGDGGPATDAALDDGFGGMFLATADDGTVFVSLPDETIRRIGPEGTIETFLGTRNQTCRDADCGDGGPAADALVSSAWTAIDVGPDGSLYFVDVVGGAVVVRQVAPDGIVRTVAGAYAGDPGVCDAYGDYSDGDCDGFPADLVAFGDAIESLVVGPDSSVYLTDTNTHQIWRVLPTGVVRRAVGRGIDSDSGLPADGARDDGAPGPAIEAVGPIDVALGPDGSVYWTQGWWWGVDYYLRRITTPAPGFDGDDVVVPAEDGSRVWVFDADGRHLSTRSGLTGATLRTFAYDAEGRLASTTDGDGNLTTIERDADGTPTAVVGPFGEVSTLTVDTDRWLASVTTPTGRTTTLVHDAGGLLREVHGARAGSVYTFGYDAAGRLTSATDPAGTTTLARTVLSGGVEVTVTTAGGRTSTHRAVVDATGTEIRDVTFADGSTAGTRRSPDGSTVLTAADGTVTEMRVAPDPRLGPAARFVASTRVVTPGGLERQTTVVREASLTDPDDPFSLTEQTTTSTVNGRSTTTTYDAASRTVRLVTPEGRSLAAVVDAYGRPTSTQLGGLAPTAIEYDGRGRLCRVSTSDGTTTRDTAYHYGGAGTTCSESGGSSAPVEIVNALGQSTSIGWDADLRAVSVTDPEGRTVSLGYDGNSKLVSVTPPGRPAHTQTFDPRDRQTGYLPPGTASDALTWTYDADGLPDLLERADGTSIGLTYDAVGRLVGRVTDHATYGYGYDGAGRLTALTSTVDADLSYGFDGGLLTSATTTGPAATRRTVAVDADFRLASETVDADGPAPHTVGYGYDDDGLVTSAGDLTITRDPDTGLVTGTVLGDVVTSTTYSPFGEVATRTAAVGGSTLYSATYLYDALGRVIEATEEVEGTATTRTYTYDGAGRLTRVDEGTTTRTYTYDANGNRVAGPDGATGTYDDQDRLQTYGDRTYTHDPAGDLETIEEGTSTRTFDYDASGNLLGVTDTDGPDVAYTLDARGRRTSRTGTGGTAAWAYRDGVNPIAQYDGSGQRQLRFVFATASTTPDYLVDTTGSSPSAKRVITDHLGSPRLVVDAATGDVIQRLDYDEFGRVTGGVAPGYQPYGFQGGLYDPDTGLVRFGVRDYDPATGRFTTRDPLLFAGGQANMYEFVAGDPVNFTDPSGLGPNVSWWDAAKREAGYFRDGVQASGKQLVRAGLGGAKVAGGALTTAGGVAASGTGAGAVPGVVAINVGLATMGSGLADIGQAVIGGPDVSTSTFPSTPISAAATNASPEWQAAASVAELAVGGGVSNALPDAVGVAKVVGDATTVVDTVNTTYGAVNGVLSE